MTRTECDKRLTSLIAMIDSQELPVTVSHRAICNWQLTHRHSALSTRKYRMLCTDPSIKDCQVGFPTQRIAGLLPRRYPIKSVWRMWHGRQPPIFWPRLCLRRQLGATAETPKHTQPSWQLSIQAGFSSSFPLHQAHHLLESLHISISIAYLPSDRSIS